MDIPQHQQCYYDDCCKQATHVFNDNWTIAQSCEKHLNDLRHQSDKLLEYSRKNNGIFKRKGGIQITYINWNEKNNWTERYSC